MVMQDVNNKLQTVNRNPEPDYYLRSAATDSLPMALISLDAFGVIQDANLTSS